jgi:hypothetical protein
MNKSNNSSGSKTAVEQFKQHKFLHPLADEAFANINQAIRADSSPQVIILTGPTGVGKSTLLGAVGKRVIDDCREQLRNEPDFVPIVAVNAVPSTGRSFNWKDFYIRLLSSQQEPLVDRKLYSICQMPLFPDHPSTNHLERSVTEALRRMVEQYLRRRRTKYLFVDEAHHFFLGGNSRLLECHFETLKSITIETGVTFLLSGTYHLLDILDQSGQLTRRSQVVHFPRYDMRQKVDRDDFRKILHHLQKKLSEYVPTTIEDDPDYFYRKSAGCLGILKDWLTRCLDYALQEKGSVINATFADRFALKNRGLVTIIKEACNGEQRLTDVDNDHLIDLLKNGVLSESSESHVRTVHQPPGQRKPYRDPVGGAPGQTHQNY